MQHNQQPTKTEKILDTLDEQIKTNKLAQLYVKKAALNLQIKNLQGARTVLFQSYPYLQTMSLDELKKEELSVKTVSVANKIIKPIASLGLSASLKKKTDTLNKQLPVETALLQKLIDVLTNLSELEKEHRNIISEIDALNMKKEAIIKLPTPHKHTYLLDSLFTNVKKYGSTDSTPPMSDTYNPSPSNK